MDIASFIIPAVVGVGIGILSGMLGIGGGTVLVPIFRLAFGMSPLVSTATSLFTIIPTSIAGAITHVRHKTCVVSLGLAAGIGGACMSPLGVWLAQISPPWMIMAAAALIIGYSAFNMLQKAWKMKPTSEFRATDEERDRGEVDVQPKDVSSRLDWASTAAHEKKKFNKKQIIISVGTGVVAGLASGYVGVGGGFIMVPLMISLAGISMKQASGTSLLAVMILAIPGTIEQAYLGNVNFIAGIAVAVGSIPGAFIGANLVRLVPERMLRFIFGAFLIVAAVILVLNELGIL